MSRRQWTIMVGDAVFAGPLRGMLVQLNLKKVTAEVAFPSAIDVVHIYTWM